MFKSGFFMMIIVMISRVLGLARGVVIAYYFGATSVTDAYFSAFKISNFFRQLLGEGALGTSFIPLYNEKVKKDGEEEGRKFIFSVLNLVFIFSTLVSITMIIFSDEIINFIVRGFDSETKILASHLLKIMSPYFIFIGIAGMIGAILNNFKYFVIPSSTSIFFNLAILFGGIFLSKEYGIKGLALGVVIGGVLQLLVQLPVFFKNTRGYNLKIDLKDEYLKKLIFLILPMLIGIVARQVNTVVDSFFASYLNSGGVTALENATRLYSLPIGVFGITISTVIYPSLSKKIVDNDMEEVEKNIIKGLNILLFLVIPCMAVFCFYSKDLVSLLFGYGKYTENAIKITGETLLFYSIGLYFYSAIHLLTRAFYGMKNSKEPVKFSIFAIILNIILNIIFIKPLLYKGLALSTSISAMINFLLLLFVFKKKYINIKLGKSIIFLMMTLISSGIAILFSYKIENSILKLFIFSLVYIILWGYSLYKKRLDIY